MDTEAEKALADFEAEWGQKYPFNRSQAGDARGKKSSRLAFPPGSAQNHYTTNCD